MLFLFHSHSCHLEREQKSAVVKDSLYGYMAEISKRRRHSGWRTLLRFFWRQKSVD